MREEKIIKMTMVHYHWIYDQFNANGTFLGHWIKLFISFGGSSSDLNIHWTSNKNVASSSGVRTVFGYHSKSLILHCELRLIEWTEVHYKCQNAQFSEFSKAYSWRSNSVTRRRSILIKIGGKCQNWNIQMRHFGWVSNNVYTFISFLFCTDFVLFSRFCKECPNEQ